MTELSAILSEFSEAIRDPSPDSDEKMKQLLRKYVKHYTQPHLWGQVLKVSVLQGGRNRTVAWRASIKL